MVLKKIIALLITVLILCFTLVGCKAAMPLTFKGSKSYEMYTNLVEIPSEENLYFDNDTKIVYIIFNECIPHTGYGYMSAYYAPNGLPYLYDEAKRKLVIIDNDSE